MELQVDILEIGTEVVVSVVGDVDAYTGPRLRRTLTELGSAEPSRVEVRMRAVDYLDSFGTGALLAGVLAIESAGSSVSVFVNERVGRCLERLGLTAPLHITSGTPSGAAAA